MDDWDFGGDDGSSWGLFGDVGADSSYDLTDAYDTSADDSWLDSFDYGSGPSGGGDSSINSSVDSYLDNDYSNDGGGSSGGSIWGSVGSGAAAGAAVGGPWGAVIGAGLGLVQGIFAGKSAKEQQKEDEKMKEKFYAFQKAEDEKYYQLHGKQLADAYQGYKQYYQAPGSQPSPTAQFGLVSPGGPSGYFK